MSRLTGVVVVAIGGALVLAGCTPAVPVAGLADKVEVSAAMTEAQQERIQEQTFAQLAAADEAKSVKELGERVGGDAKVVRAAEYKRQSVKDGPHPDVLPADMQAVYVTSSQTWPRVMVGVTEQPSKDVTPVVMLWVQDDVASAYQFRNWVHMVPGATLPAMPGPGIGADALTMDAIIGDASLQSVVDDYFTLLDVGKSSDLSDDFAEDIYRDQLFTARQALTKSAKKADGEYSDSFEPQADQMYALETADGGALVFVPVHITSKFTVKDATVSVPEADKPLVDGKLDAKVTYEYRDMIVLHIPPATSEQLPGVVAADHHLVRVSPDGAK